LLGSISVENKGQPPSSTSSEGGAYLGFIDAYENRIKMFHVKDARHRLFSLGILAWGLALETSSKNTYRVLVTRGHWRALRLEWREWRMNPAQRFAMINPETRSQNCSN
jgi:sugar phosphate isomerase/epimerase